jgi:hypothetical protein
MPFLKLTRANGSKVELNPDMISIRPAVKSLYPSNINTVVRQDGMDFPVVETEDEIDKLLKAIGK